MGKLERERGRDLSRSLPDGNSLQEHKEETSGNTLPWKEDNYSMIQTAISKRNKKIITVHANYKISNRVNLWGNKYALEIEMMLKFYEKIYQGPFKMNSDCIYLRHLIKVSHVYRNIREIDPRPKRKLTHNR